MAVARTGMTSSQRGLLRVELLSMVAPFVRCRVDRALAGSREAVDYEAAAG
jgi:hypothetical protein